MGVVGIALLGGCQQDDPVSAACRDLAARTADAAMNHGAAVREAGFPGLSGQQRIDAADARLDSLKDRYANAGCSKEHLQRTIRNAFVDRNDQGVPATDRPTDIPPGI